MWNETEIQTARSLIANMIGERDRTGEMGEIWNITPDMLPQELSFEASILDTLLHLRNLSEKPTKEAVTAYLTTYYDIAPKEAETRLEGLLKHATFDRKIIDATMALYDSIQQKERIRILKYMVTIAEGQRLTGHDMFDKLSSEFSKISPIKNTATVHGIMDLADKAVRFQAENAEKARNGQAAGPQLPWKESHDLIPFFFPREVCVIAGKSGAGKTTIGQEMAVNMAHVQGYNVVYVHLETDPLKLMFREFSKRTKIPMNSIIRGYHKKSNGEKVEIDLTREPYLSLMRPIKKKWYEAEKNKGHVWFYHCPDYTPSMIEVELRKFKMKSDAEGRELVIIIDYFQTLHAPDNSDADVYNNYADQLKVIAESLNAYMFVLAQLKENADTENIDNLGGLINYSNKLPKRAQYVFALESDPVTSTVISSAKNYFGETYTLQEAGDTEGIDIRLRLLKGNDNKKNGVVNLKYTRPFYTISSPNKPATQRSF